MAKKLKDFSYKDLSFTPKLDISGDVETVTDFNAVRQSIISILTTRPGERVMRPEFGSNLWELLFEPMDDTTEDRLNDAVSTAIRRWEPRVILQGVKLISEDDFHTYNIIIAFSIKGFVGSTQTLNITLRR